MIKGKQVYLDQDSWRRLQSAMRLARHWTKCPIIQVAFLQRRRHGLTVNNKDHILCRGALTQCSGQRTSTSSCTVPTPSSSQVNCIEYKTGQHPRTRLPPSKASQACESTFSCEFSKQQTDSSVFQCKVCQYSSLGQVPNCWLSSGMQSELGADYNGPLDMSPHECNLIEREIEKLIQKGAVSPVDPVQDQFISQIFVVPKKEGRFRPVVNLKALNRHMKHLHFKMEGAYLQKDLLQKGLDGIHRSKGCVSIGGSGTALQTSPEIYVGRATFPVSVPSIWTFHCPLSVYQGDETGDVFAGPFFVRLWYQKNSSVHLTSVGITHARLD